MRWLITFLYTCLLGWASLTPARNLPLSLPAFAHADKLCHFLIYGILAALLAWSMHLPALSPGSAKRCVLAAIVLTTIYGALMELGQGLLKQAGRSFSVGDLLANALGAAVFVLGYLAVRPGRPATSDPQRDI